MKVWTHDDMDGLSGGAVIAKYFGNYSKEDFTATNYNKGFDFSKVEKDEKVIFVDLAFSETTAHYLTELMNITDDIIWIDHHKTSIELENKYPVFKNLRGIRQIGICGSALAYMYFNNVSYDELPLFLKYVSDFDCWHLEYKDVMEFKYGMESKDMGSLSDLWVSLFAEEYEGSEHGILNSIINEGKIIKVWVDKDFENYRNSYGYESTVECYSAFVVNRESFSQLFGDLIDKYDICLLYAFDGKQYKYSIYSSDKGNVDVSKIAQKYGGGGHVHASGFSSKEKLW